MKLINSSLRWEVGQFATTTGYFMNSLKKLNAFALSCLT